VKKNYLTQITCGQAINKALAEILADGTYKKINDKYFTINVYTMKAE
jgi:ABC-type amino acid transport substrate-binding protein